MTIEKGPAPTGAQKTRRNAWGREWSELELWLLQLHTDTGDPRYQDAATLLNQQAARIETLLCDCDSMQTTAKYLAARADKAEAVAAPSAAPEPSPSAEWRDIGIAPHTEHVLVRFPSKLVAIAYLTEPCPPMVQTWRWAVGPGTGRQLDAWPTGWLPLPPISSPSRAPQGPARGEGCQETTPEVIAKLDQIDLTLLGTHGYAAHDNERILYAYNLVREALSLLRGGGTTR